MYRALFYLYLLRSLPKQLEGINKIYLSFIDHEGSADRRRCKLFESIVLFLLRGPYFNAAEAISANKIFRRPETTKTIAGFNNPTGGENMADVKISSVSEIEWLLCLSAISTQIPITHNTHDLHFFLTLIKRSYTSIVTFSRISTIPRFFFYRNCYEIYVKKYICKREGIKGCFPQICLHSRSFNPFLIFQDVFFRTTGLLLKVNSSVRLVQIRCGREV